MKFRKKPVVIEARQLTLRNTLELRDWCGGDMAPGGLLVRTLEGAMQAREGDWIIRGVKGEFYPCRPDIFEMTYEAVDGDPPAPAIDVEATVTALWDDVTDRRGIKHEFNQCDADVKDEIRAAWSKIIRAALGGKEQR